jgi:hypothetical protein
VYTVVHYVFVEYYYCNYNDDGDVVADATAAVVVEVLVTINYIKTLSVVQQEFYGTFMSPATTQITRSRF